MICEICGRDSHEVARTALREYRASGGAMFMGMPNPYPGPTPVGEGRGWIVPFDPAHRWFIDGPGRSLLVAIDAAKEGELVAFAIATCGRRDCMQTAKQSGVPGRSYSIGIGQIDRWLAENPA